QAGARKQQARQAQAERTAQIEEIPHGHNSLDERRQVSFAIASRNPLHEHDFCRSNASNTCVFLKQDAHLEWTSDIDSQ
ncbi:MAG TPA: hypothetical protein VF333_04430, partial [Pyrinomonadaceae bacterium]